MKKCFTINPLRTTEEFESYHYLIEKDIYQAIEIFYPYNQEKLKYDTYTKNVQKIKEKYPNIEVVMHLPFGRDNNLCADNYLDILRILKDGIKYTSQFGTKKLTLHLGYVKKEIPREDYLEHIIKVLEELCDYAKKYDMSVMIENIPRKNELGCGPNEILDIIKKVNHSNLKFIFDTGHANVSEYENLDYLYLLKDYLYHIHFSDNSGLKDEHKRIGLGNIDFNSILKVLKQINYQELGCMEIIYKEASELEQFAQDLDKNDN